MEKLVGALATALAFTQISASAHAPVVPLAFSHGSASISSAHTLALIHSTHTFVKVPVSGSSQAFYKSIKFLSGASIKNTVLNAPLSNISGQFNGTLYYNDTGPGLTGTFYSFPAIQAFGNNPLNNNAYGEYVPIPNVSTYINGGLAHAVAASHWSTGVCNCSYFALSAAQ